jgi:hypothetical protein
MALMYDTKEIAKIVGCSHAYIFELIRKNKVNSIKVSNTYFYDLDTLKGCYYAFNKKPYKPQKEVEVYHIYESKMNFL